jgi:hypothetical protein
MGALAEEADTGIAYKASRRPALKFITTEGLLHERVLPRSGRYFITNHITPATMIAVTIDTLPTISSHAGIGFGFTT